MNFEEYQKEAIKFAFYPNVGNNLGYPLKGLFSEVGEVADKLKKIERDKGNIITPLDKLAIAKELGDVLWYVSQMGFELGVPLEHIALMNVEKLTNRKEKDTLKGSGDDR